MKEMNREEIEKVAEMVAEKASEKLGLETVVRTIDKVDRKLTGITVLNGKEICCSPTFYIDEYAPKIAEKLVTVEDVAEKMSHFYREKFSEDDVLNVYSMINNFDSIKEFLSLRIVNKTFNPEYLTDVPYIPYLDDFAIILGIDITLLHGNAFVKVTKHLLDLWGKEFAEVKAIAEMNDSVFCKPFLHKIAKSFCRLLHLHFVGNCKTTAGSYSASHKPLQIIFSCYNTRYGNGSSEFSSSCACSLK